MIRDTISSEAEIVKILAEQFQAHLGKQLKQLILFGSRARGKASEDSDYDCLVVVEHLSSSVKDIMDEISGIMLYDYDVLISAIPVTQERFEKSPYNPLFINIRREGQTLWPNPIS